MTRCTILFLCTGNSCRSQMAEGWGRALKGDKYVFYSAGVEKHGMNEKAVAVMAESGVDIRGQESTLVEELPVAEFDYVVTLCGHARENCPVISVKGKTFHVGFDDPSCLEKACDTEVEAMGEYRRVRDEIKRFVEGIEDYLV